MNIIDKPGFYTSKAGKCEVVAVKDGYAFGFLLYKSGKYVRVWACSDGAQAFVDPLFDHAIIGPFIEPRKPVEAWAITTYSDDIFSFYRTRDAAEKSLQGFCNCRLIHLREVEDEKP